MFIKVFLLLYGHCFGGLDLIRAGYIPTGGGTPDPLLRRVFCRNIYIVLLYKIKIKSN
jgi:hypothetical protein